MEECPGRWETSGRCLAWLPSGRPPQFWRVCWESELLRPPRWGRAGRPSSGGLCQTHVSKVFVGVMLVTHTQSCLVTPERLESLNKIHLILRRLKKYMQRRWTFCWPKYLGVFSISLKSTYLMTFCPSVLLFCNQELNTWTSEQMLNA